MNDVAAGVDAEKSNIQLNFSCFRTPRRAPLVSIVLVGAVEVSLASSSYACRAAAARYIFFQLQEASMQSELLRSKERLARDIGDVVSDTGDLARAAGTEMQGTLDRAQARLADARTAMAGRMRRATDATNEYIKVNPWKVLGFTAAAGLVIGFLLSLRGPRSRRQ
jgi:ElaB/YqjD/DUF883 family membrane-anchored ribosome-binding protein